MIKLEKYKGNPILKANPDNEWENLCVLNPGAIYDEKNEEFVMLYLAAYCEDEEQLLKIFKTSGQFDEGKPIEYYDKIAEEYIQNVVRVKQEDNGTNKVSVNKANKNSEHSKR